MIIGKNIDELRQELDEGVVKACDLFNSAMEASSKSQESVNAFVSIMDKCECSGGSSILSGIPYALKDNFSTSGILTTGSSNILKDYVPVFDSTVYKKLKEAGAVLVGKTVLDELAMGGSGLTGHTGIVKNPWDTTRISGGSSAGSAASVSLGIVPFSIGSDTGDSVRKPASLCGIVGFKPTYGRISRFGLFPFASSLDHVGIFARNVKDITYVTDVLKGHDELDMTSLPDEDVKYVDNLDKDIKEKKLFYIKEIVESVSTEENKEVIKIFRENIDKFRSEGVIVEEVSFDKKLLECIYPVYFIISCAEATSNNSNLTGFIFGSREQGNSPREVMFNTRTKGFSEMIKRRFITGSYILQRENQERLFLNAKRARRMIVEKMNLLFKEYDGLILPAGGIAPKINPDEETDRLGSDYLLLDNHLAIGNFGGYPSITFPMGYVSNMPVGINLTCPQREDASCLNIAFKLESVIGIKDVCAGGENIG